MSRVLIGASPQKGDRVRVEFEGVVTEVFAGDHPGSIPACWDMEVEVAAPGRPDGSIAAYVRHEHVRVVEPEYVVGGLYVDSKHAVWRREPLGEWRKVNHRDGLLYGNQAPARPLTRLIPER